MEYSPSSSINSHPAKMNANFLFMYLFFFLVQVHHLPGASLLDLANLYVEAVKAGSLSNGKSLELFPNVLKALSSKESLVYGNGNINFFY